MLVSRRDYDVLESETSAATAPIARPTPEPIDLDDPRLYLNRELSWLEFNERVLAEAYDPRNPLLERVKFVAITASNLDEFYSKRVGWLRRVIQRDPLTRTVDDLTVTEQLRLVLARSAVQRRRMEACWREELLPRLNDHGVRVVKFEELDGEARRRLHEYFVTAIFPVLTPLVVDPAHPFPFISGGSLSLACDVRRPGDHAPRFARVKVPQNRPRFIEAGDMRFVPIEDLIAAHFDMLFPGVEVLGWQPFRVLRSIEVGTPGEEADDLLELIERELQRRRLAQAVILEVDDEIPTARVEMLLEELELTEDDVVASDGPLGLADLFQIAALPLADLSVTPFKPAVPSAFASVTDFSAFFGTLRQEDVLVHHPYESFDATVARFVEEAASDPTVLAIKQTMYRTSPDSPIFEALIDAAGRGKQVAVLVELTARFDEANNIEWARKLENAGVHVAYGAPDLKIHSKICLIVREEAASVTMYAHIGTGNYNSRTANVYTDVGLFTSDPVICQDLVKVFNYLTGLADRLDTQALLVAPENLRDGLERRVRREIDNARAGKRARVVFKMNALEDREFTRLLYEASQAGVQVDLIVRGICRLRTGLPGISERVRVVSVIGRFLEHSRIFAFENDGDPEYFIGSADIMKRNLDERIEVLTPVHQDNLKAHLRDILELMLADVRQGWELRDSAWSRDPAAEGEGVHATLLALAPFS